MTFETEYMLQEFREMQSEHFDENGKVYAGLGSQHWLAERMLKLINQLEKEIKNKTQCQCPECQKVWNEKGKVHDSDCAVHNEPAYPNEECNCSIN